MRTSRTIKGQGGFTLVEILVVLVIIIALAAAWLKFAPGALVKKNVAAVTKMTLDVKAALLRYKADIGTYPANGLQPLWDKTAAPEAAKPYWQGPYMDQPNMTNGTSPTENIQDTNNAGVIYSFVQITAGGGGTGNCTNVGQIVPNNATGIANVIKVAGIPQDVAWALSSSQGNGVCISQPTDATPDAYFLVEAVWGNS